MNKKHIKLDTKKILMFIMIIISLSSIYILFIPSSTIHKGLTAEVNNNGFLTDIVNTISKKDIYIPVIIISVVLLIQLSLSIFFLFKYDDFRFFAYAGFIGGGLGLHVIYLIIVYLSRKIKEKNFKIVGYRKVIKISSTFCTGVLIVVTPIVVISAKSNNEFYHLDRVVFSRNKKAINVIEIYTDALDRDLSKNILTKNKDLQDFTLYNNFLDTGSFTHLSKPTLDEGFENNPFQITRKHHLTDEPSYKKFIYSKEFARDIVGPESDLFKSGLAYDPQREVVASFSNSLDRKYIGNYINVSSTDSFTQATSGSKMVAKKLNSDAWGMNYLTAKRLETNGWGITKLSPEVLVQKQIFKQSKVSDTKRKGAHLYLHDLLVHGPFYTNKHGEIDMDVKSIGDSYIGYSDYLSRIIASLKQRNIYNNSLIFMYGDHGNHGNPYWNTKTIATTKYSNKSLSALFIKFPYERRNNIKVNTGNVIYGPWLKKALNEYVESNYQNGGNLFKQRLGSGENKISEKVLDTNPHFILNENRKYPYFMTNHTGSLVHFVKVDGHWMLTHCDSADVWNPNNLDKPFYDKFNDTCFSNSKVNNKILLDQYKYYNYKGGI